MSNSSLIKSKQPSTPKQPLGPKTYSSALKTLLPTKSGVSLKAEHYQTIIEKMPNIGWFEIHPENYMNVGGPPHRYLTKICEDFPLSMHGVGLSLGSSTGLDEKHLKNLKNLVDRYEPAQVSEHLSWSHWNQNYFNDLLPLQLTKDSFSLVRDNISRVQDFLQRTILVENPSTYIEFKTQEISETDFLNTLCDQTGCGILLDVNNVSVCSFNHSRDTAVDTTQHLSIAKKYLQNINYEHVGEIHLAGHATVDLMDTKQIRIDDHGSKVSDEVWGLYDHTLAQANRPIATLVEWDTDLPSFDILLVEANKADEKLTHVQKLQSFDSRHYE